LLWGGTAVWECCILSERGSDGRPEWKLRRLANDLDPGVAPLVSPDGTALAYVCRGNLVVREREGEGRVRITTDGGERVLNGRLDWVYEEELAHRTGARAFQWSPDSTLLAYLRLDQSAVPTHPLLDLSGTHAVVSPQRYPQPGDSNSRVSLRIVARDGTAVSELEPATVDGYLAPQFTWQPDSSGVVVARLPRSQRELELCFLRARADCPGPEVWWRHADAGWVNYTGPAWVTPGGIWPPGSWLWIPEGEDADRLHVATMGPDGFQLRPLSPPGWNVTTLLAVGRNHAIVLAHPPDPRERRLLACSPTGWREIRSEPGFYDAEASPDGNWLTVTHSTVDTPPTVTLMDARGAAQSRLYVPRLEFGPHLPPPAGQRLPEPSDLPWARGEWHCVRGPDGQELYGQLLHPPDHVRDRPAPAVVRVYGGPHGQQVRNAWLGDAILDQLLVARGVLVWRLDNRGSWGRGHRFEAPLRHRLGHCELEDQLAGVEYLKQLPAVDPNRVGICGWSYGGYLTLYALARAPHVWACGIAGAPVTDWLLYDSIYTERYMGTPAENPDGYEQSSVLQHADAIQAPVLLIHGLMDDNVHVQHTLELVETLSRAGRDYELLIEPGQRHSFEGRAVRRYLNQRILAFFERHLGSSPAAGDR
ncbi:MAG: hypothetical protein FJX77_05725, partial [Armatimonadetes bacterium]|nr:hypothetical protein [Armatimonadota bacterium]